MKSLNTYNFQEELGLNPYSFDVSISEDDKIIRIEEDGDLIAELSFLLENNILSLIGKDNLEVAQIELPNAMSRITSQKYNPDEMAIELGIEQTNGKTTTFCLDVKELVDVYTAGDGIDITDNVISIKIKDAEDSALSVDKDGLGISFEGVNGQIDDVKDEIARVETKVDAVDEKVDIVNRNIDTINEALDGINDNIANINTDINKLDDATNNLDGRLDVVEPKLDEEINKRVENDNAFDKRIDALEIAQNGPIKEELERLDEATKAETDRAVAKENELQNSLDELNNKVDKEIGDRGESDKTIAEDITDIKANVTDLTSRVDANQAAIEAEVTRSTEKDTEHEASINSEVARATESEEALSDRIDGLFDDITSLESKVDKEIGDRGESETSIADDIKKLKDEDVKLNGRIDTTVGYVNTEKNRAMEVEGQLKQVIDDEILRANKIEGALSNKITGLTENLASLDEKLVKEIEDRTNGDNVLKESIKTNADSLNTEINVVKSDLNAAKVEFDGKILAETNRAKEAEEKLTTDLANEVTRATDKEAEIDGKIVDLTNSVASLDGKLDNEISDRELLDTRVTEEVEKINTKFTEVDGRIDTNIANIEKERNRATDAEKALSDRLDKEVETLNAKDADLKGEIDAEVSRASLAESMISNSLQDEIDRAKAAEGTLTTNLANEVSRATTAEGTLTTNLDAEIAERKSEDKRLTDDYVARIAEERRITAQADDQIKRLLDDEEAERKEADTALKESVTTDYTKLVDSIEIKKDDNNNLKYGLFIDGVKKSEINIPEDKMLKKVGYDDVKKEFTFTWNESSQQEPTVVNVKDLVDTYTASNGIMIDPDKSNNFIIPLNKSKYIKLVDGEIDVELKLTRPEGSKWTYHLLDGKGNVNGNIINFNEDVNKFKADNDLEYAHAKKVELDINDAKNAVLGSPSDKGDVITVHGVRNLVTETVNGTVKNMVEAAKTEAVNTAGSNADQKDTTVLANAKAYTDGEVSKLTTKLTDTETDLRNKYLENGKKIATNSANINQLSTGLGKGTYTGGDGVFDELHKLFHDLTHGIDENNMFEYLIKLKNGVTSSERKLTEIEANLVTVNEKLKELDNLYWEAFGK